MRHIIYPVLITLALSVLSCKDKVICPAFQSTYILNDSIRMAKYSLFGSDSLPKFQVASRRNKYGIRKNYGLFERQKKNYDLMTAPKVNVLGPPAVDPIYAVEEEIAMDSIYILDSLTLASLDSLQLDSLQKAQELLAAIPKSKGPKYKYRYKLDNPYNHDQEYYNKHYGQLLIDNRRPPVKKMDYNLDFLDSTESDSTGMKKKKKFGAGIFNKKKNNTSEETISDEQETDEIDSEIETIPDSEEEGGN